MRIAIFGTGGAGGYFGAHLARCRRGRGLHRAGRAFTGDSSARICGLKQLQVKSSFALRRQTIPTQVGAVDVVLVGVKTWQVTDAATSHAPDDCPAHLRRAFAKRS